MVKKAINDPERIVGEVIEGLIFASHGRLVQVPGVNAVMRAKIEDGKVALLIGGGSGHEPIYTTYVGPGFAEDHLVVVAVHLTEHDVEGYALYSKILPLYNSGQVNFFGPNSAAIQAEAQADNFYGDAYSTTSSIANAQLNVSRQLFDLPGGPVSAAAGTEFRKESFKTDPNPTVQIGDVSGYGGNFIPMNRSRDVTAAYGERHPGFSPRTLRAMLSRAGLGVVVSEIACREPKKPHFEVVLAIADKPKAGAQKSAKAG